MITTLEEALKRISELEAENANLKVELEEYRGRKFAGRQKHDAAWTQSYNDFAVKIYFTSDLHLGHKGIITMQNRPFESVEDMNRILLTNYNAVVGKDDTVYILGDICHHMSVDQANSVIARMKGKKYLINGNHDKKYDPALFEDIKDFMTVSLNGRYFALMHYPMLSWPKKNSGSIQLHGHIHARMDYNEQNRNEGVLRYDVGVDANNFYPVSVKQIIEFFEMSRK